MQPIPSPLFSVNAYTCCRETAKKEPTVACWQDRRALEGRNRGRKTRNWIMTRMDRSPTDEPQSFGIHPACSSGIYFLEFTYFRLIGTTFNWNFRHVSAWARTLKGLSSQWSALLKFSASCISEKAWATAQDYESDAAKRCAQGMLCDDEVSSIWALFVCAACTRHEPPFQALRRRWDGCV